LGHEIFTNPVLGVVNLTWDPAEDDRRDREMPHIIVTADRLNDRGEGPVMLSERVNAADFESGHFAARLVERLGWAVADADEAEQPSSPAPDKSSHRQVHIRGGTH
jgi:hypothetical protein